MLRASNDLEARVDALRKDVDVLAETIQAMLSAFDAAETTMQDFMSRKLAEKAEKE